MIIYCILCAGKLVLASTPLDPLIPLHHPITTLPAAGGHRQVQGAEQVATRPQVVVDITGEAPIINRVSRDCVDSVTLATHAS